MINDETIDKFILGKNLERLENYKNSNTPINFKCLVCDFIWHVRAYRILKENKTCPSCLGYVKLTNEKVDQKLLGSSIVRLGDYINTDFKILFRCNLCCYEWKTKPYLIVNKISGCPACAGNAKITNDIIDQALINVNIERVDNYINSTTPIKFKCLSTDCNYVWLASPSNIIHGNTGCASCYNNINYTNYDIDLKLEDREILRIGNYINNKTKINFQCLRCNYIWPTSPSSILNAKSGCPKCNVKFNEEIVYSFLLNNNIEFVFQKSIKNIDHQFPHHYILDFFIKDKNLIIEYNGRQHYEPVCFGGISIEEARINFEKQTIRDLKLREFCKVKSIDLLEIDGRIYKNDLLQSFLSEYFEL